MLSDFSDTEQSFDLCIFPGLHVITEGKLIAGTYQEINPDDFFRT